ncbi:MAG: 16S rRNA (adenine(1518)-N(6)/adenine(1519)-N(6))-dimethyltransferase RsmA [Patescibacteria group bacterium]
MPDTTRGQHFLVDDSALDRIARAVSVGSLGPIIEVGAGIGNLTSRLCMETRPVLAIELDRRFQPLLDKLVQLNANLSVLYRDILSLPFATVQEHMKLTEAASPYSIVGNIPYYITGKLLSHIMSYPILPTAAIFLLQDEVVQRIVAEPGAHSKLSLGVQFYGVPEVLFEVPRSSFYPRPEVDSALLRIANIHSWNYDESEKRVWQLINIGFSAKRKKLVNNLAGGLAVPAATVHEAFTKAGIDENIRAQGLSKEQWRSLARLL